jgi:hypothetical protein
MTYVRETAAYSRGPDPEGLLWFVVLIVILASLLLW